MSLKMIYGRAGSGKTRLCLDEIKSKIAIEKPLILLVPEQYTFQAERDLIDVLETGGILKTEVLSFRRLAYKVFNEVGGITYPHIHPSGKCMMIYKILDKMKDQLIVLSKSANQQGFVNTLSTLITELKRYNITPDALENMSTELEEETLFKNKMLELSKIYMAFERNMAKQYRDADDDLTLAAEKLKHTVLYDDAEIWIDGFSGFTPQEYSIIAQLLQKVERINISLCTDTLNFEANSLETDIFSSVKKSYKKLLEIADEYSIVIEPPIQLNNEPPSRFEESSELVHLEKYLYAYPYKTYQNTTENIELFSSVNIFEEIEAAARDIIRLCRDKNMMFRDIAVLSGNLTDYGKLIEVIFDEYNIPYFIDRKVDIIDHPLVQLILSMLEIFYENWSYESVFRYLKTGLTGIDQEDIDILENYVLACGIRGNQWTKEQDWNMSPDFMLDDHNQEEEDILYKAVNSIRYQVVEPLKAFRTKTKGRRKALIFCEQLYDFLVAMKVPERIEEIIERFKENGQLNEANEYSQVWNIIMEVFDQTVEVMGDETFGIEKFTNILRIGFGEYKTGLIPASLDQVLVGSIERFKSHEIKAMYVLGANDGVFPNALTEEGILSDQDRSKLNDLGVELANDTRAQAFEAQYLVYRALTTAGHRLRVSWAIADHEGKTLRPSIVISRLRKLFPAIKESSNIIQKDSSEEIEFITNPTPTFRHMVSVLRQKVEGKEIKPIWETVYRWFASHQEWEKQCLGIKSAFQYKNVAQTVSRDKVEALYGSPPISSVSRIEKYTSCPFAFYIQYGLKAKERKIYQLSPPDVGTFMHAAIERFSRIVSDGDVSWRDFDRAWCNKTVSAVVDEMIEKMTRSGVMASKKYVMLIIRLKRVISRAVWLIAEHIRRSGFDPVAYEVGFGKNEKYPPIAIELDSGEVINLTGRIDRVDVLKTETETYLRIVDYKSGNKDFKLSDVYYGLQLQLITYLDAIWESQEKDDPVLPGGMLYFKIDDPIVKGQGKMTQEEVELAIMKQLKMRGLLLSDVKLIKEMDHTIEKSSLIIPATINKGDKIGKNTSAATLDQFNQLRKHVKQLLKDLCNEVMKGNVAIQPYKKKDTSSCQYCDYLPVCQFDTSMSENTFKLLYDKDNEEVWHLIEEGIANE